MEPEETESGAWYWTKKIALGILHEWVLIGIVLSGVLAYFWPHVGSKAGPLHIDLVNSILVGIVFFIIGLTLNLQQLKDGTLNWKSHLCIQFTIFVFCPTLFYSVTGFIFHFLKGTQYLPLALAYGIIITGCLPTTFDTSVIFVTAASGDIAVAILNGTGANLIGIFLTPLLLFVFLHNTLDIKKVAPALVHLTEIALVPVIIGLLSRFFLFYFLKKNASQQTADKISWFLSKLGFIPKLVLIWLTWTTFCTTFESNSAGLTKYSLLVGCAILTVLHILMILWIMLYLCILSGFGINFDRPVIVSHLICGSQKTMTLAIPIISVIYENYPQIGVLLIPVIVYHTVEVIVDGVCLFLLRRWVESSPKLDESPVDTDFEADETTQNLINN